MRRDSDITRLTHIIDAAEEALHYAEGVNWEDFKASRPLQHSIVRCIEVIGEASARISDDLRQANPQVPWADIIAMRNRIVHAYFDIDVEVVWKTAVEDLPALLAEVKSISDGLMRSE